RRLLRRQSGTTPETNERFCFNTPERCRHIAAYNMSLHLHEKCLQKLSEKISEGLAEVKVHNGMFLDRFSTSWLHSAESILPQSGKDKASIAQYVSESPVH